MKSNSVRTKIKSLKPSFSETENTIAQFILDNAHDVSYMTISELAQNLGIANSTVFKFTRKLGYKGFRDFRNDLLTEEYDPQVSVHEHINPDDTINAIAEKIFSSSINSLQNTLSFLKQEDLVKALAIICNARRLSFFGCGGSNIVAYDAYHKFLRSPILCQYAVDEHIQIMQASLSTPDDAAIVVSHSGLSKTIIQIANILREKSVPLIFITSYLNTPITKFADVTLISTSEETGYRTESLSSRIAQLVILDTLFCAYMFTSDSKAVSKTLHEIRNAINQVKLDG